jgi:hypothetical protein
MKMGATKSLKLVFKQAILRELKQDSIKAGSISNYGLHFHILIPNNHIPRKSID